MRKPGGKNADGTSNRGQQVSVIAQENLKLGTFLFHCRWRCTFDLGGYRRMRRHSASGSKTEEA